MTDPVAPGPAPPAPAPTPAPPADTPAKPTIDDVKRLIEIILPVPWWWAVVIVAAIVLSVLQLTRNATGDWSVTFQVTATTVALFGALWLPSILRVVAVAGGSFPTPGGTASTQGISGLLDKLNLDPETKRAAFAPVAAAIETSPRAQDPDLRAVSDEIQKQLANLPITQTQARAELDQLSQIYKQVRSSLPSGPRRTNRMTEIAIEARGVAAKALLSPDEVEARLASADEGDRIVGLAAVEQSPNPAYLDAVAAIVDSPKSAFEQYRALVAVQGMLGQLTPDQRQRLVAVLEHQRSGAAGTWISSADQSRWILSVQLLKQARTS